MEEKFGFFFFFNSTSALFHPFFHSHFNRPFSFSFTLLALFFCGKEIPLNSASRHISIILQPFFINVGRTFPVRFDGKGGGRGGGGGALKRGLQGSFSWRLNIVIILITWGEEAFCNHHLHRLLLVWLRLSSSTLASYLQGIHKRHSSARMLINEFEIRVGFY